MKALLAASVAAVAFALAAPVLAQTRFEQKIETKRSISGLSEADAERFNGKIGQIGRMLAAIPQVAHPPDGMCTRLGAGAATAVIADSLMPRPMATGGGSVQLPVTFVNGKCSDLTDNGIGIVVNSLAAAFTKNERLPFGDGHIFTLPPVDWERPGIVAFKNGKILITKPGVTFYVPVSKREYLAEIVRQHREQAGGQGQDLAEEFSGDAMWQQWIRVDKPEMLAANAQTLKELEGVMSKPELAKMRTTMDELVRNTEASIKQMIAANADLPEEAARADDIARRELAEAEAALAALGPMERGWPACVDPVNPRSAGPDVCPPGTMLVRPNPQLFADARSAAEIRLIFVSPGAGGLSKLQIESQRFYELRMAIYRGIDLDLLAGLVD